MSRKFSMNAVRLASVLLLIAAAVPVRADVVEEYRRADAALAEVEARIRESEQRLAALDDEKRKLAVRLSLLDEKIEYHETLISRTEADISAADADIRRLNADIRAMDARIAELKKAITGGNVYLVDNADWLGVRMLVFTRQLHQTVRNMEIIEKVNTGLGERIIELKTAMETRTALASERLAARERLVELKNTRTAEKKTLESRRLSRQQLLNVVKEDSEAAGMYLSMLADESEALSRRVNMLAASLGRTTDTTPGESFTARKGRLPWPVSGSVVQRFGKRRVEGFRGTVDTNGIRIAPGVDPIVNVVAPGTIAYAGFLRGLGTVVIVAHGATHYTLYAGLAATDASPGDPVDTHTPIGRLPVDLTGQNPYLYFEIREGDTPVDPAAWLIPGGPQ